MKKNRLFKARKSKRSVETLLEDFMYCVKAGYFDLAVAQKRKKNKNQVVARIPAGYTYFGQFISHDLSFTTPYRNLRTPLLDLDSVYAAGPLEEPLYYDQQKPLFFPVDGEKTIFGQFRKGSEKEKLFRTDLARVSYGKGAKSKHVALIPDSRNDENIFVSQLHTAFLLAHNRYLQRLINEEDTKEEHLVNLTEQVDFEVFAHGLFRARGDRSSFQESDVFPLEKFNTFTHLTDEQLYKSFSAYQKRLALYEKARRAITWHYQWLVLKDFLPRIVPTSVLSDIWGNEKRRKKPKLKFFKEPASQLPLEFIAALFRFGHSMVRNGYPVLRECTAKEFEVVFSPIFAAKRIKEKAVNFLDWRRFFFNNTEKYYTVFANKIDAKLVKAMRTTAGVEPEFGKINLLKRNVRRGFELNLCAGQDIARQMQKKLKKSTTQVYNFGSHELKKYDYFLKNTPLWWYMLLEAKIEKNGRQLGEMAGRIIAEVLIGTIYFDKKSFLHQENWQPFLIDDDDGFLTEEYTMINFLRYAGVYDPVCSHDDVSG